MEPWAGAPTRPPSRAASLHISSSVRTTGTPMFFRASFSASSVSSGAVPVYAKAAFVSVFSFLQNPLHGGLPACVLGVADRFVHLRFIPAVPVVFKNLFVIQAQRHARGVSYAHAG